MGENTAELQNSQVPNNTLIGRTEEKHKRKKKHISSEDGTPAELNSKKRKTLSENTVSTDEVPIIRKKKKKKSKVPDEDDSVADVPSHIDNALSENKKSSRKKHKEKGDVHVDTPGETLSKEDRKETVDSSEETRRAARKQKKLDKKLKKSKQKEEEETTPKAPSGGEMALDYLTQWSADRPRWKFQKVRQVWLLQHVYSQEKIPDEHFTTLLLYLDGLKGKSRELTLKQAEEILTAGEDSSGEMDEKTSDVSHEKLDRARQVIQVLT